MSILDNFGSWKQFLANRLQDAQKAGMSHETITNLAAEVGDYLAENVEAKTGEEAVLKDLWNNANEQEQQAIASSMIKLVQNEANNR